VLFKASIPCLFHISKDNENQRENSSASKDFESVLTILTNSRDLMG